MEFKTVTGGKRMIVKRYKQAKEKNVNYVFMLIESDFTPEFVRHILSGYIKKKGYTEGFIFTFFPQTGEFYEWSVSELAE